MTVVLAIPFDGGWVLGADSRSLAGYTIGSVQKLFECSDGYAIGFAGSLAQGQYVVRNVDTSSPEELADALFDATEDYSESGFLWSDGSRTCTVDGDGSIQDEHGVCGMGSGSTTALGFLSAHEAPRTQEQAETLLIHAIEHVSSVDVSCGGPVHSVVLSKQA